MLGMRSRLRFRLARVMVFFVLGLMGEEELPTGGFNPAFKGHFDLAAAVADLGVAHEEIGHLHRAHYKLVMLRPVGFMVELHDLDKDIGQELLAQITGTQFGVVHAQHFAFKGRQVRRGIAGFEIDFLEVLGKGGGHDDLADVVDEPGQVIDVFVGSLHEIDDFAGHERGADAVAPKFAPREAGVAASFWKSSMMGVTIASWRIWRTPR